MSIHLKVQSVSYLAHCGDQTKEKNTTDLKQNTKKKYSSNLSMILYLYDFIINPPKGVGVNVQIAP